MHNYITWHTAFMYFVKYMVKMYSAPWIPLTNEIGQQQIPASHKCPHFSYSHIAVKVGRAHLWHTSTKLSVAQSCKDWSHCSNQERDDDTRTSHFPRHLPWEHVNPCSKRAANTQANQIQAGQASAEVGLLTCWLQRLLTGQGTDER